MAFSEDTLALGMNFDDATGKRPTNAVYVFVRDGASWSQRGRLRAADGSAGDGLGQRVDLSADTVVVSSPFDDEGKATDSGSAYVFVDRAVDSDGDGLSSFVERTTYGTDPLRAPPAPSLPPAPVPVAMSGYWMLEADGSLYEFGDSPAFGPVVTASGVTMIAFDRTAAGDGLWVLDSTGNVHVRGTAKNFGDVLPNDLLAFDQVASISATPTGLGYWVFTDLGQVLNFGDTKHFNDLPGLRITPAGLIVASAPTPSGKGYYMLGSDGGVFAFGDAQFVGSIPGVLAQGQQLNSPINGLVPYGNGYLMVASDGGVFTFSDLAFLGSLGSNPPDTSIVAITAFAS